MLKVDEKKLLDEIDIYKTELSEVEKKADAEVAKMTDVPDSIKAHIKEVLIDDFSTEPKSKLDYLMKFVNDVPDTDPVQETV